MRVDLERSIELTKQLAEAKSPEQAERIRAERAAVDERFDPEAAIEGAATYLETANGIFGADDLAVESYHMGIGNLESVSAPTSTPARSRRSRSWSPTTGSRFAQLYFDSSPQRPPRGLRPAQRASTTSPRTTCGRCAPPRRSSTATASDRDALERTAELALSKATLEEVFHPESETDVFDDPGEIEDALRDGDLVPLPDLRSLGWIPDKDVGELAGELDQDPSLYRALRPEALATLSYIAGLVENQSGVTQAAADHQRGPRPRVPGAARAVELAGDRGVLAAHDRLVVRRPAQVRERRPGAGVPARDRPAQRPRR